ncbi:MAG: metallophosphoesterase [Thaumarchaeota archaeon]|nr:metallophosphoesterase [Candidatus Calditenuaceae archaeon]MDW8187294.1 metallophosphoesterase [Nitrososphaerota archaeon]
MTTSLTLRDFKDLLEDGRAALSREPAVLSLNADRALLIGDLHGDLESLKSSLELMDRYDLLIFLGDVVDRGPHQLEVLVGLLRAKLENLSKVRVIRGNHETAQMNYAYGFYDVVTRRFGAGAYGLVASFFAELPIFATLNGETMVVHGGIPIGVGSVRELSGVRKQGEDIEDGTVLQLLWNDPDESVEDFAPSWRGSGVYVFGRRTAKRFLEASGLRRVVRAHEPQPDGLRYHFNGSVITVFSCRHYGISPAALELGPSSIRRVQL